MRKRGWPAAAAVAALVGVVGVGALSSGSVAQAPASGSHVLVVPSEARTALSGVPATELAGYESFDVVEAEGDAVTTLVRAGASVRDDMRVVQLEGGGVDPLTRAPLLTKSGPSVPAGEEALAIVQFVGPIKDAWRAALADSGVRIVTYQAENAYLVHGTGAQLARAASVDGVRGAFVYRARDKTPAVVATGADKPVAVSTLSGSDGATARAVVKSSGGENRRTTTVVGLSTAFADLSGADVRAVADDPGVVSVEVSPEPELHDESSIQIVAGAVDPGTQAPTGPGYLAWNDTSEFSAANLANFVIDIADSGLDTGVLPPPPGSHPDFNVEGDPAGPTRIAYMQEASSDPDNRDCAGHGTHVASSAAGFNDGTGAAVEDGALFNYGLGVAPRARLGSTKVFACSGAFSVQSTLTDLVSAAYANGARVGNNSWGAPVMGEYNALSREYDAIVRDARPTVSGNQQMVEIFTPGNAGIPNGPQAGTTPDGYGTIGAPGTAKNVITVGASEGVRSTTADGAQCFPNDDADNADDIAPFSSRGPTDDGRQKPDVVAPGTHIISAKSGATGFNQSGVCRVFPAASAYAESDGTSMAAPQVTGAAALIRDWYRRTRGGGSVAPSPAMTKALLVNSATDLAGGDEGRDGFPGNNPNVPARSQGWGRVNLGSLLDTTVRSLRDQTNVMGASGETTTRTFTVADTTKPVKITLAWSDAPGSTVGSSVVNNLDLEVARGADTFVGNRLTNGLSQTPGGAPDAVNNVESVYFPAGTSGQMAVTVRALNVAGDGVPGNGDATDQDYALVVTNATTTPEAAVVDGGGATATDGGDGDGFFEPGERVRLSKPLSNLGDAASGAGVTATLTGALTPITGSAGYPVIGPNASAVNTPLLEGRIPSSANCGSTLTATVSASGGVQPIAEVVSLGLGAEGAPTSYPKNEGAGLAIPDGGNLAGTLPGAPVVSSVTLPDSAGVVRDLDVAITSLTHPWVGDLLVRVTSPAGTTVTLVNRLGNPVGQASNNNLSGVIFDDEGPTALSNLATANTDVPAGRYRPASPLSAFDGQSAAGTWTLSVQDFASGDTGSLGEWAPAVSNPFCANTPFTSADGAVNVGTGSADLRGAVGPAGVPTAYRIDYGPTTAYGASTPVRDAGEDVGSTVTFAEGVGGLAPGTTYHYRVVALRDGNVVGASGDSEFTTAGGGAVPAPPGGGGTPPGGGGGAGGGGGGGLTPAPLGTVSFRSTPKTITATTKRRFTFKFTGTASKSGKATFTTKVKRKTVRLGSKNYKIDSRGRASIVVTLSRSNYNALKKAKKQKVTATITIDGRDFKRTFTLKPPKPKKKT